MTDIRADPLRQLDDAGEPEQPTLYDDGGTAA